MRAENNTSIAGTSATRSSHCRRRWSVLASLMASTFLFGPGVLTTKGQDSDPLEAIGIPPLSSQIPVENGYIDPAVGSLHLEIPLGTFTQRGGRTLKIALTYSSNVWTQMNATQWGPQYDNGALKELSTQSFGEWTISSSTAIGFANYTSIISNSNYCAIGNSRYLYYVTYKNFSWTGPDGDVHLFPTIMSGAGWKTPCADGSQPRYNYGGDEVASDASGYHMYISGGVSGRVFAPDGTVASYFKDSNGNVGSGSLQQTDTLGRTPLTVTTNGNLEYLDVLNSTGGTSRYTVTLAAIPVATNFSSAGSELTEYPVSSCGLACYFGVIQSIQLPDGTSYSFAYDSGTAPGHYGEITSMTLPTGGQIAYTYANFTDEEYFAVGKHVTRMISTMTTPDGKWTFSPTVIVQCTSVSQPSCQHSLAVMKPSGDKTIYTFNFYTLSFNHAHGLVPIEADYYSGTSALLARETQTFSYPNANPAGVTPLSRTMTLPNGGANLFQTTQYCHDPGTGNLLNKWEWNFYTGSVLPDPNPYPTCTVNAATPPDRTTTYTYLSGANYSNLASNISDHVATVTVTDKNSNTVSQTINSYDDWAITGPTGIKNHDDTNYGASFTARGNLTQVKRWLSTSGTWLITKNYYDILGNLIQTTDPNSNNTYFDYTDNFYGISPSPSTDAYITKTTKPATNGVNHIDRSQYYFGSGLPAAKCGENFPAAPACAYGLSAPQPDYVSYSYDGFGRTLAMNAGDGGQTTSAYGTGPSSITITVKINSTLNRVNTAIEDALGRTSQTQASSAQGTVYVDTTYDSNGRIHSVSNPHFSSLSPTDGITTYASYDGLDRVLLVTGPDNGTVTTSYSGNCKTVTDEAQKTRKSCFDGFGRMTGVWEDPSNLNLETDYQYDLLGNLTSVVQGGSRQRTFTFDSLSRLVCAANPEMQIATCPNPDTGSYTAGTTRYAYDANGNVLSKTAPKPNQTNSSVTVSTNYLYDPLNRITQKSYSDGTTPAVQYGYDAIAPTNCSPSLTMNYPVGRRTAMCDGAGTGAWSYDVLGRTAQDQRTTNGVTKTTTYATRSAPYNYDGSIAQLGYPSGRTITYTPDSGGHSVSAVDTANNIYYSTVAQYAPQGELSSLTNGAAIVSTLFYNSRLQPCRVSVKSVGTPPTSCADLTNKGNVLDFTYNFNAGAGDDGNVSKVTDNTGNGPTLNYTYDTLNRIASAYTDATSGPQCSGETFTIDTWSNLMAIAAKSGYTGPGCTNETLSLSVNGNNQVTNTNFAYDAAGNLTNEGGSYGFTYDAENRISTVGSSLNYYYDGDGRRVRKSSGTMYWYGLEDNPLEETDGSGNLTYEYIFFNGKRIARRDSSNNIEYYFADRLGSARVVVNASGATLEACNYYPYGASNCPPSSINNYLFTGKERDGTTLSETGLDYFGARYYSSQFGRFMTPDWTDYPGTVPYADFTEPQSLNLYSYVGNNPLNRTDPDGHHLECDKTTYSTGPDGQLIVDGGKCHEVPDPPKSPSVDEQKIRDFAQQLNKRPIVRFSLFVYGAGATIGAAGGAACYVWCSAATVTSVGAGTGSEVIQGLYGGVTRAALATAANSGGETVTVVTNLTSAPAAGQALSTATGEGAEALANAARTGGQTFTGQVPKALLNLLEKAGLAFRTTTSMGGATAQEIRFTPQAVEFVSKFFR